MARQPGSIGWFAAQILGKPLYPYQEEVGDAILDSIINGRGETFTCMMSRQSGKNQLSAVLESYLLFCMEQGTLVKAAPTFKPQIINSRLRLLSMLDTDLIRGRVWKSFGYMIGLAPEASPDLLRNQIGPRIMFFSAGPESNIVGATASILLEIDEAQDVAIDKYDRDLRPMASTTNATTVLYGTAWSDDTLLAIERAKNLEYEEHTGIKRHFEYDWRTLAAINPKYKKFVEGEIARLGEEHITIRTQYRLLPISGAGFLLSDLQRYMLRGTHQWETEPSEDEDGAMIAALDAGGEERPKPGEETKPTGKRDSTVVTIGRVRYNELDLPSIEIVHQQWWQGMRWADQYAATAALMQRWNIRKLVVDATGLGEALASLLIDRLGDDRVISFKFSRQSKSRLTYQLLSMVNSGRLKLPASDEAPSAIYEECWKQLRLARYRVPGEGLLTMYVDEQEGHDDFLISVALCTEAVKELSAPVRDAIIVKPQRWYDDGRF
jgi:terminase large subunit-like protein